MQITKLSFLSTQAVGDNVFAIEEFLEVPIDQIFGSYRAREKALFNFIDSDAVQKVSRDTWRITKDITLDAANVKMRQGDYFRVRLDEEGDDSPIHFGLDATGVFVLSRAVFASLQTYRVLEPGKQESIRMQFTFGGNPVIDAKLTNKFSSMSLVPVDATAGIYELKVYTAMAPSDDMISIEVTGTSLGNNVYEAPVRITVREPVLTVVPIDVTMAQKQTKTVSWQLLMEGVPAPVAIPVQAQPDSLITKVLSFTLADPTNAIYEMSATAGDAPGTSPVIGTYDFGRGYVSTKEVDVTIAVAPGVFITPDTTILEANQTQLIRFYARWSKDNAPVTNALYSTTDIRGPGLQNVEQVLVPIDPANGLYGYRVTTNHKGGSISVRTNITSSGIPYPVFFDLTSKSTPVQAVALNTLPAADTQYLTFRVQQERLGGLTPLVGVIAKQFTVTGTPVIGVQGAVEAVGQGVYRLKVVTNDKGGTVAVSAILTIDGEDVAVAFTTTAAVLSKAIVVSTSSALVGETSQPVPLEIRFEGAPYDLGSPTVKVTGSSLVSTGALRRVGVGEYEIQDVNVNGKGGILTIEVTGLVHGFSQTMTTTVAVNPVAVVVASNVTHYRPTTQGPLQFTALRDGLVVAMTFSSATLTGGGVASYNPIVDVLNANTGRFQVRNVVASAPTAQAPIGVSIPYKLKGYSYTLVFNTYTEAMPILAVDTKGVIPEGSVKHDYLLYFTVDGQVLDLTSGTVQGSGPSFVSVDSPNLERVDNGVWAVKGLLPGPDRGQIVLSGTVLIDGITYPYSVNVRSKDTAPDLDLSQIATLEAEMYQTVYFKLSKKGNPIGDATLANGIVTGAAIESFDGFALHNAITGEYRFNVITNGKGGAVDVNVDITIDGDVYPTHFTTTAKPGKVWGLTSSSVLVPATSGQAITFSITNDGTVIKSPYLRALDITGVHEANKNIIPQGLYEVTSYVSNGIRTGSPAADVKLMLQASTNNVNWHDLDKTWNLPEASKPVITVGPMIPAVATSILTLRITRDGRPLYAPTFSNLVVNGDPVDTATLDWVKLNANGTYGTTIKTNDKGGAINVAFDILDDGVTYHMTATGQADIVRPWTATLVSQAPKPEALSNIDFQSMYGGAPIAMSNVKLRLVGDCVVSPAAEVDAVYQDGTNQIYRMPNVLVNNDGGPITLEISGTVYDQQVSTVLQMNVVPLPDMQIVNVSGQLPFRQTVDWAFDVNRGAGNPTLFTNADVTNLNIQSNAINGYTPTIVPQGNGRYAVSVQTNSVGGPISMAFDVTIAGQTTSLYLQNTIAVEPPVTATSLNTLETDSVATNMDFQLMRGTVPCADAFVVKSITMNSRSIISYPQTVLNVDVATGKYRIQVNTSAYSDPVPVTINATVRGEDVTLTFTVQVKQGVLPVVSLTSDAFIYNLMSSGTLSFTRSGAAITGVTVQSIDGPLDSWSMSGNTLNGKPTVKGQSTLTINFLWKGALYSGDIIINPVNSIMVVPIGDPKLKAYVPNTINFPLVQDDGSAYPAATTFTVAASPFTATTMNKKADGTYTMDVSYAGELLPTNIIVTATNGTVVTKHIIAYSVWFNMEARFSGTALLDSTQVSNQVQFDVYETNLGGIKEVYTGVNLDSLDVDTPVPDDLIGFSTFQISSIAKYRGTFFVSTKPVDLSDPVFQFFWVSPLGRQYTIRGKFRVQKPVTAVWPSDPGLNGGQQSTVQFHLVSGTMPIPDAIDAGTTVTNAVMVRGPYLIDAATGLYGLDVKPSGNASSMGVTVKVKQAINSLTSNLATQTLAVTPGAYAAVPMLTLQRSINSQNLDLQFTQGGVPLSGVVVNSVSFNGAITTMGSVTAISGTTYRWPTIVSLDGATPHMVFNITVAGVGMVLEVDYPITAPVKPTLVFNGSPTWTRGVQTTSQFKLQLGIDTYSVSDTSGTPYTTSQTKLTDGQNNAVMNSVGISTDSNGQATGWLQADITMVKAGTQTLKMDIVLNSVTYTTETVLTVADAAMIQYIGTYALNVSVESTINFRIDPPSGVTLSPTAVPTLTTPPFPITQAIVANGDGTYTMKVKPNAETLGVAAVGTIVSGGTTYTLGGAPVLPAIYQMIIIGSGTATETAGGNAATKTLVFADGVTNAALNYRLDTNWTSLRNPRVSSSIPSALKTTTPTLSGSGLYNFVGTVATNMVDFATLTWLVDFVSPSTGHLYKDIPFVSVVHDVATVQQVTQVDPILNGKKVDVRFQLKWTSSGNPVTNAQYVAAHTVVGGTADATLKVIDAINGIYAVSVTPDNTATSMTITPRWTYPNSTGTYIGTAFQVTVVPPVVITQRMFVSSNGSYTQPMTLKIDPTAGLMGSWNLINITQTNGFVAWSGTATPFDATDRLYRITMSSRVQAPNFPANFTPVSEAATATFSDGTNTIAYPITIQYNTAGARITAMGSLTTAGGEFVVTPEVISSGSYAPSAAVIASWLIQGRNGEALSGIGGDNTYTADGKFRINVPAGVEMKNAQVFVFANNGNNIAYVGSDFAVQLVYGTTITGGS